jgi:hypothetical protein
MDKEKRIQQIEQKVVRIKEELGTIGPMRPGSLTRQYRDPENGTGAYWQISYTRDMKGRSEYIRPEWVTEIRKQIATHKRFRHLTDQWVGLSIEHSKLTMQIAKTKGAK